MSRAETRPVGAPGFLPFHTMNRHDSKSRIRPRWQPMRVAPALALIVLAGVCFLRLVALPSGLIVDGRQPSVDHANRGEPRPVGNDLTFLFLPHHLAITRVISQYGHLPLWDARGFGGRPLVGNPQAGMFYPPVWAVWWSGSFSALGWLTIGHLLWGGLGVYVLMRSAAQGRLAATVAAGVYQASPLLLAQTFEGHYPHVWAACWYPWAFWCYSQARAGHARGLLLPPVLALALLAGHPQEWLLLVVALSAWCLADAATRWRALVSSLRSIDGLLGAGLRAPEGLPPRARPTVASFQTPQSKAGGPLELCRSALKPLAGLGLIAFSIALAAVDVIPQLAVRPWLLRSQSPGPGVAIPRRYHLELLNGFQLLSPTALGGPADYFGADNYWETVFSIGLVPFFLAVVAVLRHPDRKIVRGWLILVGLAFWFACGRHLGFYTFLYYLVPGMSWFRVPARSLFLANLGAAVLSGLGIQTLQKLMGTPGEWNRLALRSALILGTVLAALCAIDRAPGSVVGARTLLAAGRVIHDGGFQLTLAALAALLVFGSFRFSARNPKLAVGLAGLLAMAELGREGHALIQVAPASQFLGADPVSALLHRLRSERTSSGPLRIKVRDSIYGDLRAVDQGFEKTNVNDVFQLEHAAALYETLYPIASRPRRVRHEPMEEPVSEFRREVRQAVFDRMSVEYLVSDRFEKDPGWPVAAEGSSSGAHFVIERNPSALPRAYVVPHAAIVAETERFTSERFRASDSRESVLMYVDPLRVPAPGRRQPFTAANWKSTDPDRPVLRVTTDFPGLLVVTDTWMPGWTARVDGERAPILRGNHAQRVIPLPQPGQHTIALDYRPPGFAAGCAITAISAVVWLLACGCMTIARKQARRSPDDRDLHARNGSRAAPSRHPVAARQRSLSTTSTTPTSIP
jgi:hypothetical protein